jgi:DNA end-binding protein Ku
VVARSIASLSLSFGLVSIPIKLYSATESSSAIHFKLMSAAGSRVRQQYVADAPADAEEQAVEERPERLERPEEPEEPGEPAPDPTRRADAPQIAGLPRSRREIPTSANPYQPTSAAPVVLERSQMGKGYEFEKGKFVIFTADELKALAEQSRQEIDIVAFIPEHAVDPIYYQKAYFLAPDKRGAKPYNLLLRAMTDTRRSALAKWAFRSKEYVVEIRPTEGGLVLQQLLFAEEVRSLADLNVELLDVGDAELKLAKQLIEQISVDTYDPTQFVDEEKKRILAAVEEKIAGKQIVAPDHVQTSSGAQVVDLMTALRASLQRKPPSSALIGPKGAEQIAGVRKPVKRATTTSVAKSSPPKGRAKKR